MCDAAVRIRVMCVDDHPVVRDGLAMMIGRQADMEMVATAANGEQAVALYRRQRPDVTIMDLQLGAMTGVEAIRRIRNQDAAARIVVLTMSDAEEDVHQALQAGAAAYLMKDTVCDDLLRTIREISSGRPPAISPAVRVRLAQRASRPALTPREVQVLDLVRKGLRNKEVAASLGIAEETAQSHVKSILSKLDVPDRTAAIDVALRRGILHLSPAGSA